jgi:hypothetical protein
VVRLLEDGVVVDLGDDVEGFIPRSQLDIPAGEDAAYYVREGLQLELRVIEFDGPNRRIVLTPTGTLERLPGEPAGTEAAGEPMGEDAGDEDAGHDDADEAAGEVVASEVAGEVAASEVAAGEVAGGAGGDAAAEDDAAAADEVQPETEEPA